MTKEETSTFYMPHIRYGFTEKFSGKDGTISWRKWSDELKITVLRLTPRQRKIVFGEYNTEDEEDEAALNTKLQEEEVCEMVHRDKEPADITKARNSAHFKTIEYQRQKLLRDKEAAWEFLMKCTDGDVKTKVETLQVARVHKVHAELITDFGVNQERDLNVTVNLFKSGKPDGEDLPEQVDMRQYLDAMTALQVRLKNETPVEKRETANYLKPEAKSKAVCLAAPAIYDDMISSMRKDAWNIEVMDIDDKEARMVEIRRGKEAYKDKIIPWAPLRKELMEKYDSLVRVWTSQNRHNKKVVTFMVGSESKPKWVFHGNCNGCGEKGHKVAQCPLKGKGDDKSIKGTRNTRNAQIAKNQNNSKTKDVPCKFWLSGSCTRGQRCNFSHELKRGSGSSKVEPNVRLRDSRISRFVESAATLMTQDKSSPKKRDKHQVDSDSDSGSDGSEGAAGKRPYQKKRVKALMTQLAKEQLTGVLMVQMTDHKVVKVTQMEEGRRVGAPYDHATVDVTAFASGAVIGENTTAWDFCAANSLSDQDEDFLWLDDSPEACSSVTIVTANGNSGCIGRGPIVHCLSNSKEHGTVLQIDCDSIKIPKSTNSPVRVTSAGKMQELGLIVKSSAPYVDQYGAFQVDKRVECVRTGAWFPITIRNRIEVVTIVKHDARNHRRNKMLKNRLIPLINDKSVSPIVTLQKLDHTVIKAEAALSKNQPCFMQNSQESDSGVQSLEPKNMYMKKSGKTVTFDLDEVGSFHSPKSLREWDDALVAGVVPPPGSEISGSVSGSNTLKINVPDQLREGMSATIDKAANEYMAKHGMKTALKVKSSVVDKSKESGQNQKKVRPSKKKGGTKLLSSEMDWEYTWDKDLPFGMSESPKDFYTHGIHKRMYEGPIAMVAGPVDFSQAVSARAETGVLNGMAQKALVEKLSAANAYEPVLERSVSLVTGGVSRGSVPGIPKNVSFEDRRLSIEVDELLGSLKDPEPVDFVKKLNEGFDYRDDEVASFLSTVVHNFQDNRETTHVGRTEQLPIFVLNVSKLSQEKQARLWHWRLGHPNYQVPVKMSKKDANGVPIVHGVGVTHCLNEDCIVCTKAKFRSRPFRPVPILFRPKYPPYFCIYIDGFGGQNSMKTKAKSIPMDWCDVPTIGGAVGGYAFYCASGGSIVPLLYSKKSQFPLLLKRFILAVYAKGFKVGVIKATDSEIVQNKAVERICEEYDIQLDPPSVGTPEDMGQAEKAIGDLMRLARAFVLGAPHLPSSTWGAAVVWAGVINEVLPKDWNDGITPFENATLRPPNMRRISAYVYGSPCEANLKAKGEKADSKWDERTTSMYWLGTEGATKCLVYSSDMKRIYSASRRKVSPLEGAYVLDGNPTNLNKLKEQLLIQPGDDKDDGVQIDTVPTIRSLKVPLEDHESGVESDGFSPSRDLTLHREAHELIVDLSETEIMDSLLKQMFAALREPAAKNQLLDIINPALAAKQQTKKLTESLDIDGTEVAGDRSLRRKKLEEAKRNAQEARATELATIKKSVEAKAQIKKLASLLGPMYKARPGTRVKIKTVRFDGHVPGSYSDGKPEYEYGVIRGKGKRGTMKVLWDGDSSILDSDWKHLEYVSANDEAASDTAVAALTRILKTDSNMAAEGYYQSVREMQGLPTEAEPWRTLHNIERTISMVVLKTKVKTRNPDWPKDFAEMLMKDDWREWLEAILKEHTSWQENQAVQEVGRETRTPGTALVRIGELLSKKRSGQCKFRPFVMGNMLKAGRDFHQTFSGTVAADTIRYFVSLAVGLRRVIKGGDVRTAYLAGDQIIEIHLEKPSYWDYCDWPIETLMELRKLLKDVLKKHGMKGVRKLLRSQQNRSKILKVIRPIYGIPNAGNEYMMLLIYVMVDILRLKRSAVDPALYYKTDGEITCDVGPFAKGVSRYTVDEESVAQLKADGQESLMPYRRDSCWTKNYLLLITWTDDIPYYGTPAMEQWYETNVSRNLPMVLEERCEDFVSIQIKQDDVRMLKYCTHSKYCLAMGAKYEQYLTSRRVQKTPMKPATESKLMLLIPTEEEHEKVQNFPYMEVLGTVAFPTAHTKIECKHAVSVLSRYGSNWTLDCIEGLLDLITYMVHTHDIGIVYSYGLDQHGINTLYGFTDSSLNPVTSQGGNNIKMNGGAITGQAKKHPVVDTSTTMAELTEAFMASNTIAGFRNLHREIGLTLNAPTTLYCDNNPACQIIDGDRTMSETTRSMDLKIWKLRERSEVQEVYLKWCSTKDEQSDINTKALPTKQFRYLRDNLNGYALVMLHYPEIQLPDACINRSELIAMISELYDDERARNEKKNEKKKKRKSRI